MIGHLGTWCDTREQADGTRRKARGYGPDRSSSELGRSPYVLNISSSSRKSRAACME